MAALTEAHIIQRLAEAGEKQTRPAGLWSIFSEPPRPAAVLVPLYLAVSADDSSIGWQVLLTHRTNSVAEHQDQVAFPGGRADPTDVSPEMTALREAHEEIGLDPLQVKILGRMAPMHTITNYLVTPVVGIIPWPFQLQLEETEVVRIFSIPLDWLADPANHEVRERTIPSPFSQILHKESHPVIYFKTYLGELLWGVSADITLRLIEILF